MTTPTRLGGGLRRAAVRTALAAGLVVSLGVAAFLGYGAWTRSRPTTYARGGTFASAPDAGVVSPSATPLAAAASSPDAPSPSATPSTTVRSTPSGAGSASGPRAVVPAATTAPTPTSAGFMLPAVGTYQLQVQGSEHVTFGPLSACSNTFPSSSALVVQRAAGEPAASYDFDQRFYPDTPNQHDERHIYRYTPGTVALSYEQATVTCSGIKQSSTVSYSPVQLRVELPLRVGASWHSTGGDSNRTEDATTKVTGTDTLTVVGRNYEVYVLTTHVDMTGSESGTRDQTWWWSPALGMPLQWHEALSGSRSGASYTADFTCTVAALPHP